MKHIKDYFSIIPKKTRIIVTFILIVTCVGVYILTSNTKHKTLPVYRLAADHITYQNTLNLQQDADMIVAGTVFSQTTRIDPTGETDSLGNPVPPLVHTDYLVRIIRSLKGGYGKNGENIVVSLTGGTTSEGKFILDGGPILQTNTQYLFFLALGKDDRYYPLAGGAAIGNKNTDGTFTLSGEAVVNGDLIINESDATLNLAIQIERAFINLGKKPTSDRAKFTGNYMLPEGIPFSCGDNVAIALNEPSVTDSLVSSKFRMNGNFCQYINGSSTKFPVEKLSLNLKNRTFELILRKDARLNSLTNPVTFTLQLGNTKGSQQILMQQKHNSWEFINLSRKPLIPKIN